MNIFLLKDNMRVSLKHCVNRRVSTAHRSKHDVCSTSQCQPCMS